MKKNLAEQKLLLELQREPFGYFSLQQFKKGGALDAFPLLGGKPLKRFLPLLAGWYVQFDPTRADFCGNNICEVNVWTIRATDANRHFAPAMLFVGQRVTLHMNPKFTDRIGASARLAAVLGRFRK